MPLISEEEEVEEVPNPVNSSCVPHHIPNLPPTKIVKYKECLKNHAAAMGVTATDGCGEFMPPAPAADSESLICSACGCHRNFHRKVEFEPGGRCYYEYMGGNVVISEPDDQGEEHGGVGAAKKRFRTKFSVEQKGRMLEFAERLGWKMQKSEESEVRRFCEEIGVKRRVFKVWMHNNKHNHNDTGKKKHSAASHGDQEYGDS
ncbi:Zinc-finger homeodomain protein 4 [Striga hermonthica]|uniref:Zinc-finger homeodomain protein 4 n=1 Tax=Striga hermonthica TaxID=68872 RepID=A0A9N7R667_STRHE|nr:Zinc-finger homeodomain protein 4 [Striga hermonthica]